jgi:hypothetical protein
MTGLLLFNVQGMRQQLRVGLNRVYTADVAVDRRSDQLVNQVLCCGRVRLIDNVDTPNSYDLVRKESSDTSSANSNPLTSDSWLDDSWLDVWDVVTAIQSLTCLNHHNIGCKQVQLNKYMFKLMFLFMSMCMHVNATHVQRRPGLGSYMVP